MKFSTIVLGLFFISTITNAQTFKVQSDSMFATVQKDEFENYIQNFGYNTTNETKVMRWTQKTIFKGSLWSNSQVCDNILCYTDKIQSKTIEIPGGGNTLLKLLFKPNGQDTCGYYTITVKEEGADHDDDVAHYFFNGTNCTAVPAGIRRIENVETVKIYPNPGTDYVQLDSKEPVRNVVVYDAQGRIVKQVIDYHKGLIPVSDLTPGTYYMMMTFYNGKMGVSKLYKN
ncbi:MAG: T9SS type A sorting domain-containing protein [Saprospiraceae bacterium]|nr:T9SS type A sorting domain-containing protein [Saprospiraceae bacterium]